MEFMTLTGLRDLQWRSRRFSIAVIATGLVFGITLVLSGFLESFDSRASGALNALGGSGFIVRSGAAGPFRSPSPLPADTVKQVASLPGVRAAAPLITIPATLPGASPQPMLLIGYAPAPGRPLGAPPIAAGRLAAKSGEVVLDASLHRRIGSTFTLGPRHLTVVGLTRGQKIGAIPNAFITLGDAQAVVFAGQPVTTTIVVVGRPRFLPSGLGFATPGQSKRDLLRPLSDTIQSIKTFRLLLWLVAGAIIGSVLYLSALDRGRDFAVFKAGGVATRALLGSLVMQSVCVSLASSALAVVIAHLIAPRFPAPVSLTVRIELILPAVAVGLGLVGSAAGLRRAVAVPPALAFGGGGQ